MDRSSMPHWPSKDTEKPFPERDSNPQDLIQNSTFSPTTTYEQLPENDLEDVMDISRSEADEGELTEYSPSPPIAEDRQSINPVDDEESYEPPSDLPNLQLQDLDSFADRAPSDSGVAAIALPDVRIDDAPADHPKKILPQFDDENSNSDANMQVGKQVSDGESPVADASDLDDYEPPEPAPLVSEPILRPHLSLSNPELSSPLTSADVDNVENIRQVSVPRVERQGINAETTESDFPYVRNQNFKFLAHTLMDAQDTAANSSRNVQHFTPYESPLKQFRSFRNHPEYLEQVGHGFRSLTYSHAAKVDPPICRYELDGICNDASCQSQHFKTIGLSGALNWNSKACVFPTPLSSLSDQISIL